VDRGGFIVDEFHGALSQAISPVCRWPKSKGLHTAILYRPHFAVSGLMLFRFTCHLSGTRRSVAI
jgi:hypothetical protein